MVVVLFGGSEAAPAEPAELVAGGGAHGGVHPTSFAASIARLCENMDDGSIRDDDVCWSSCEGECPKRVLNNPDLYFDFSEVGQGPHAGCISHFNCVGSEARVLCTARAYVGEKEEIMFFDPTALWRWGPAPPSERRRCAEFLGAIRA